MLLKDIFSKGKSYLADGKFRQSMMLLSVNLVTIPIGIITSIVLTKYLGSDGFGDYQFLNNLLGFGVVIFAFGFFQAGNRALVLNKDDKTAKEYFGASLVILVGLFIVMSVALIAYSMLDDNLREKGLNETLIYVIPFSWIYLLVSYIEVLFQADNKISLLAISRLMPKVGFLITALVIYFFLMEIKINRVLITWCFYLLTQGVVFIYILVRLKISFGNLRQRLGELWQFNKTYGFNVYLGSAFSVGISQLTGVLISYFSHNNLGVGFFSLALTFSNPLSVIPNTIATTNYKDFATRSHIPNGLMKITIALTCLSLLGLWIIVPPFINYFYGKDFQPVIYLNFVSSIGVAFFGLGDFFNRFIGAHGLGKSLRNTSFVVGIATLGFNLVLIPLYNEEGAAYTRLLGGLTYLACMLYFYLKFVKENKLEETN